jgi:hypothetical protein
VRDAMISLVGVCAAGTEQVVHPAKHRARVGEMLE